MTGDRRRWASTLATLSVLVLAGCGQEATPRAWSEPVYGPPHLSDWVEIEGRWEVTYDDGEGHALLQPAIDESWLNDDAQDAAPREAADAIWVDVATGETIWSRTDVGSPVYAEEGVIVGFVGDGDARTVEAIDAETGETIWSTPEGDLGACAGWRRVGQRDVPDGDGTRALPVFAAPSSCDPSRRTLLAQLDPRTGETEALLTGSGHLETEQVGGGIVVLTWSDTRATVEHVDLATAEVMTTVDLRTRALLAGSEVSDRVALPEHTFVTIDEAASEGIWMSVRWNDPDDEESRDAYINDFYIDLEAGTTDRGWNEECTHPGEAEQWYLQWVASVPMCGTLGFGDSEAYITVGEPEDASTWRLPIAGDRPNWIRVECSSPEHGADDEQLLLVPAENALVRAYDLHTGDEVWSSGDDRAGSRLMTAAHGEANRLVVLADDNHGAQSVTVLALCTGELVTERTVEGAYLDGRYVASIRSVVTVPLASTTLLAHYVDRGTARDESDEQDAEEG